jgi:hypothetical protein
MSHEARATSATLHFLAGGASLSEALSAAAKAIEGSKLAPIFQQAAEDVRTEAFRAETVARLPLDPPVAKLLLARAPKDALGSVAESALAAIARPPHGFRAHLPLFYLMLIAVVVAGVAQIGAAFVAPVLETASGFDLATRMWIGRRLAGIALIVIVIVLAMRVRRLDLESPEILRWLVASERAKVPPAALLDALLPSTSLVARVWIERLARKVRGASGALEATLVWAEQSAMPRDLARLAGLAVEGEDRAAAAERLARIAAAIREPKRDVALAAAGAILVFAAFVVASGVISAIAQLGASIP